MFFFSGVSFACQGLALHAERLASNHYFITVIILKLAIALKVRVKLKMWTVLHAIRPGGKYVLDKHYRHCLRVGKYKSLVESM